MADWSGNNPVRIDLESHGREALFDDTDLTRTVGWFSSVYPVLFTLPSDRTPGSLIKSIKEQLRQAPGNGIGYGLLRYLGDEKTGAALKQQPAAQIIFNYLGRLDSALPADSPYQLAAEDSGADSDANNRRAHEIDVIAKIQQGILQVSFKYSDLRFRFETIEALGCAFLHNLQNLIRHCRLPCVGGYTPSDFPLARISQQELDGLALTPAQIDDIYPLTPLQQGLVFHSLYAGESGVYCILLGCRLQGAINISAFKQAWQQTIDRHSILRTGFLLKDTDMPLQFVCRNGLMSWSEPDWQHLSNEQQEQHWQDFQSAEWQAGFDFAKPPLMRLTLIRCSDERHYFAWSFHHLLQDGWSMSLILKDVFDCYQALSAGSKIRLPAAKPYRNYIEWMQRQELSAAETYWRNALAGFTAPTPLFADKKAGTPGSGSYGQQNRVLSGDSTARLQVYAQNNRLTLNTLIQGAWAILLSRYSGEREVMFGVTVSGRPTDLDGIETMVGLFINTLPLRVQVPADADVTVWLQQLLEQNMTLRQYEYTPLVNINGWSEIPTGQALFDSLLVFENYPADKVLREQLGSLSITGIAIKDQTHYPLTVTAVPGVNLDLTMTYDQRYVDEQTIVSMLGHFENILEGLVNPHTPRLSDLRLLTEAENRQILLDWNATQVSYPQGRWLHQLFEQQAETTPDAVAVIFEQRFLSYAELNSRANQLAHYLQGCGIGPDVRVGVCMERSPDRVIALLAVLKAGGAYVPMDPGYPQQRLDFMLRDVNPPVILTQSPLLSKLAASSAKLLCLDTQWPELAAEPTANLSVTLLPEHLAYCIYTSGSTGQPKGADVPHQGILNRLQWMQAEYRLDAGDRVLQKTPFSFDVSVWEFFWPLMTGATLVVAPPEQHKDSSALIDLINRHRVTTLHFVPSMLQAFLDTPGVATCTSLTRVICSGEALAAELVRRFYQHSGAELHNLYGPTEASVDVSYWPCRPDTGDTVPIGKPIANIELYILDRQLNPVPVGIPGELHIGGIGLARGYLNRADLSAEKFIPNPFCAGGGRLYKTGDLSRYRPDGNIEYLGRIDHQVKIRGFRIELGEIEARLQEHQGIKEAVVLAREDQPGDKRLVAYIVVTKSDRTNTEQLRDYLVEKLPEYMVPSAFVYLDAMPLSSNGKLDRNALPVPDRQPQRQTAYVAPRNDTEKILSAIWEEVLDLESIGIEDNFFTLGGDSIRSLQVINLAKERGINISLEQLYRHGTIRDLAEQPDALQASIMPVSPQSPFSLIAEHDRALLPEAIEDAYPLSTLQAGMIFHSEYDKAAYHLVDSIELRCELNSQALQTAIRQTVARHPALRTAFDMGAYSEPLQLVFSEDKVFAEVTVEDWRDLSAGQQQEQFKAWLEMEKSRPFAITQAPLIRFHIHQFSNDRFRFTVAEHHAILDGWSLVSMLNEIFSQYMALMKGNAIAMDSVPANALRDLVVWERAAIQSEPHRRYWQQRLADAQHSMLPSGIEGKTEDKAKTKQLTTLSPELTQGLQRLAKSLAVPLKTVLLSAHLKVLSMLYGERKITTGLVCSIRPETADADRALGVFLNTLPFPMQLDGGSWRDFILNLSSG